MLYLLGEFLGQVTIFLFVLTIMNYIVKFINKKFRPLLKKNEKIFKLFNHLMKFIVKYHRVFGLLTVASLLSHFLIQFNLYGIRISGGIAASVLILQVGLGIYGYKTKKRGGIWLWSHRLISLVLLIAILIHVL